MHMKTSGGFQRGVTRPAAGRGNVAGGLWEWRALTLDPAHGAAVAKTQWPAGSIFPRPCKENTEMLPSRPQSPCAAVPCVGAGVRRSPVAAEGTRFAAQPRLCSSTGEFALPTPSSPSLRSALPRKRAPVL